MLITATLVMNALVPNSVSAVLENKIFNNKIFISRCRFDQYEQNLTAFEYDMNYYKIKIKID